MSVPAESFRPSSASEEHIWELLDKRTVKTRKNWVRVRLLTAAHRGAESSERPNLLLCNELTLGVGLHFLLLCSMLSGLCTLTLFHFWIASSWRQCGLTLRCSKVAMTAPLQVCTVGRTCASSQGPGVPGLQSYRQSSGIP